MGRPRWTTEELRETTNKELILAVIVERKFNCTYLSPLYRRLTELGKWVLENVPNEDK